MSKPFAIGGTTLLILAFTCYSAFAAIVRPAAPAIDRPHAAVVIRIVSPVVVSDESVQLGAIGEIRAMRDKDKDDIHDLRVAQMPEGKDTLALPSRYIESRVREVLGADRAVEFDMPETIELRRQPKRASESRFVDEVKRLARAENRVPADVDLRVEVAGFPGGLELARGADAPVSAQGHGDAWNGPMLFKLSAVDSATGARRELFVQARLRWIAKRWVSVRDLGFKAPVSADDFTLAEIEVTPAKNPPLVAGTREELGKVVAGAYMARALPKGQPLLASQIARDPDVQRGQKIKVVFRSESGLRVIASGEAMKSATVGSPLKARLERTGRIVSGQLVEKDVMEMGL